MQTKIQAPLSRSKRITACSPSHARSSSSNTARDDTRGGLGHAARSLQLAAEMAGERTKLIVRTRERLGSSEARRLRRTGVVPGVLYGRGEPVAICVDERELRRALTGAAGLHSILDVEVDGTGASHASILKEYQVDRVRGGVTHVDLQEVRLDQPITATVTVQLVGGD